MMALICAVLGGAIGGLVSRGSADEAHVKSVTIGATAAPTARPDRATDSVAAAASRILPSVVSIQVRQGADGDTGSGIVISRSGYILTNNHVVAGALRGGELSVTLPDKSKVHATVVGEPDTVDDIAVIKVSGVDGLRPAAIGDSADLAVGDLVVAVGSPLGLAGIVTSGIVSALNRPVEAGGVQGVADDVIDAIQTDAAINPGNSGGALVDANGNLLGINTAIYSRSGGSMGIGFAIPVSTARQVMESLIKEGRVVRGWIGVEPRDLTPEIAQTLNLPIKQGVLITGVLQNGPAGTGGMRPGDVVVKIAGTPVVNTVQLLNAVAALKPQAPAEIAVQRGDKQIDLTVTVAQRPPAKRPVER
jgi:S1-C subfamily serine protease